MQGKGRDRSDYVETREDAESTLLLPACVQPGFEGKLAGGVGIGPSVERPRLRPARKPMEPVQRPNHGNHASDGSTLAVITTI